MATIDDTQASNRLSERLRNGLALAQTRIHTMETRAKNQWTDLPAQLRAAVDRAVARLRTTLDLPSRSEVSDLVERLEALDRKIGALEKRQGKRAAESTARESTTVEASGADDAAEGETAASDEAAASADPAAAQLADDVDADADAEADADADAEVKADAKAGDKTTARKTVKPTSAGKTVKAGGNAARGPETRSDNRGAATGLGHAHGRKKGHRR
jgi:hypothetical protein